MAEQRSRRVSRAAGRRKGPSRTACPCGGRGAPAAAPLPRPASRAEGEGHTEDQESTMDMYITALEPARATPGPRSGDCLGLDPEAAGIAIKIAPISRQIWDAKYRLKAHDGTPIDFTIKDSWRRA